MTDSQAPSEFADQIADAPPAMLQELFDETARPFRSESRFEAASFDSRPRAPLNARDAGLTQDFLCDLTLRHLLLEPTQRGIDLCQKIHLSWPILQTVCKTLRRSGCVELVRGHLLPDAAERITLTPLGREQAQKSLQHCHYIGPAPVSFSDFARQCRLQTPLKLAIPASELQVAFADLCFDDETFDAVGSALSSVRSLLLRSETGNGKTTFAKRIAVAVQRSASPICLPYAVLCEGAILTVYDPQFHIPVPGIDDNGAASRFPNDPSHESWNALPDERWRVVRRPRLIVPAELIATRWRWSPPARGQVVDAPPQIKANGGVCILDDVQRLPPEFITRLELMLDERIDFLEFADQQNVTFPVDLFLIACVRQTRLDPSLARRFRAAIELPGPNLNQLAGLLSELVSRSGQNLNLFQARELFERHSPQGRPFNFSDPGNLLETLEGICRFRELEPSATDELLELAARRCWGAS